MKYEYSQNSNDRRLHVLFIPESIEDQKVFNEDHGDLIDAHINEAVEKRLGDNYLASSASKIEKYEYHVEVYKKN